MIPSACLIWITVDIHYHIIVKPCDLGRSGKTQMLSASLPWHALSELVSLHTVQKLGRSLGMRLDNLAHAEAKF